jgi:hypothetical protein
MVTTRSQTRTAAAAANKSTRMANIISENKILDKILDKTLNKTLYIMYKSYGGVDSEVVGLYDNPAKVKPYVPHKMASEFDRFCGRDTAVSIYSCGFTLVKYIDRSIPETYIKGNDLYIYLGIPKSPGYSTFSTYKRDLDTVIPRDRVFID